MASNVPLTIQTSIGLNYGSKIVIGSTMYNPPQSTDGIYWFLIVNSSTLAEVASFTTTDNTDVPAQLTPYLSQGGYLVIVTTQNVTSPNVPAGALYAALVSLGAGKGLARIEQIYAALNCGNWGTIGYNLVALTDNNMACDDSDFYDNAIVSTYTLMPTQIGSNTVYFPAVV